MNLVFLRGAASKSSVIQPDLQSDSDMWTQLAARWADRSPGRCEIWLHSAVQQQTRMYGDNVAVRIVDTSTASPVLFSRPDVVFARGGFRFQSDVLRRMSDAFRVYYGAGARNVPNRSWSIDLVLLDSVKQMKSARSRGWRCDLLVKPAADNVFRCQASEHKPYDVIFVANYNSGTDKGHARALSRLRGRSVLCVGDAPSFLRVSFPWVKFTGRVSRFELPALYSQAKVALVWTAGKDSCPRVIPEALACGCPVAVCVTVPLWDEKYISDDSGERFNKRSFDETLSRMLSRWSVMRPRLHYDRHLSVDCAADHLIRVIGAAGVRTDSR